MAGQRRRDVLKLPLAAGAGMLPGAAFAASPPQDQGAGGPGDPAYLDWIERTLAARLSQGPIGTPVAVRAFFQLTTDHNLVVPILAAAAGAASKWLGSTPRRLYAQGGAGQGYATVLAEFAGGQTAVLTSESLHPAGPRAGQPSVAVLILGNHGTLSYDDAPGGDGLPFRALVPGAAAHREMEVSIGRSLRAGKPVEVGRA